MINLLHGLKVKRKMRIGELARATGCRASRIRFYEQQGLIAPAARRDNGYREYPDSVVATLRLIVLAQSFGFSLAEISDGLHKDVGAGRRCDHVIALLKTKLADTDSELQRLTALRAKVTEQIDALTDR